MFTGLRFHKLLNGSLGSLAVDHAGEFPHGPAAAIAQRIPASFADETEALGFAKQIAESPLTAGRAGSTFRRNSPELFLEEEIHRSHRCDWMLKRGRSAWDLKPTRKSANDTGGISHGWRRHGGCAGCHRGSRLAIFGRCLEILREAPAAMSQLSAQSVVLRLVNAAGKTSRPGAGTAKFCKLVVDEFSNPDSKAVRLFI